MPVKTKRKTLLLNKILDYFYYTFRFEKAVRLASLLRSYLAVSLLITYRKSAAL